MISLPLVTDYVKFPQTAAESIVNFYADKVGTKAFNLRCTPGLRLFGIVPGSGGIRGILCAVADKSRLFVVRGSGFYEWTGTAFVKRGNLLSSVGPVGMNYNSTQCIVVDANNGYGYTYADTASFAVISPFQGGNSTVCYSSMRMVTCEPGTGNFWVSDQDDVFTWNPLAGAEAESFPDPIVGIGCIGQTLFILGSSSYEVWVDQGYPEFPFRRVFAGQNIGCAAQNSICSFGENVYFLGGSAEGRGIVYRTSGYQVEKISSNRIDEIIQGFPGFSDAVGFVYQEQGHVFYVLSFGLGDQTLVYDMSTGLWAQRNYRNPESGIYSRRPEICQCIFNGANIVGDFRNGNVYEMARSYFTDAGDPVIREKVFPVYPDEQVTRVPVPPFALFLDMGNTPSGVEAPAVMMSFSDNRGASYGMEYTRAMGRIGEYNKRIVWSGQGSTFGRNYRVRLTGNQDFVIRNAALINELQA